MKYTCTMTGPTKFLDDSGFSAQLLRISGLRCPSCNHNLSGATDMRCSECGVDIEFRLQLESDAEVRWYTSILLSLCGLTTALLVFVVVSIGARLGPYAVGWNMLLAATYCACIVYWIRHRNTITFNPTRRDIRKWVLLLFVLIALVIGTVAVEQDGLIS